MKYPNYTGTEPCASLGVSFYFSDVRIDGHYPYRDLLNETCDTCPMLAQCRAWALHHEEYGFWAGTTARERVALRRELGISFETLSRVA